MSRSQEREWNRSNLLPFGIPHTWPTLDALLKRQPSKPSHSLPKGWTSASNGDIREITCLSENTTSRHLAALLDAGVIVYWRKATPTTSSEYVIVHLASERTLLCAKTNIYRQDAEALAVTQEAARRLGISTEPRTNQEEVAQ